MVLAGKLSTELDVKASATKFYNVFASQLHEMENINERIHAAKLQQGDDWHHSETVKHWAYVIDGKVQTCNETIELDEENKKVIFNLFGGDIGKHYTAFKFILEIFDKIDGGATTKWIVEYEKINEDIDPPNGYIEYLIKCTKDIDAYLDKA